MKNKLITVIVPVYNTAKYLKKCIDSILNQSYKNIEIILIDDGSSDGSGKILDIYNINYEIITVIRQKNCGVSAARNKGLDIAKGEYVCFLDSDDWLEKDALSYLINQIKENLNIISSCDRYFVKDVGEIRTTIKARSDVVNRYYNINETLSELGTGNLNLQSSCYKLFPMSIINNDVKIRFNERISHGEDGLFVFETLLLSDGIFFSTEPKWYILERAGSATTSDFNPKMLSSLQAIEIMLDYPNVSKKILNLIKKMYINRVLSLMIKAIKAKSYSEYKKLRKLLNRHLYIYLFNSTVYEILVYLAFLISPVFIVENIISKRNGK